VVTRPRSPSWTKVVRTSMATATRMVTYADQETALTGFLAWDEATPQPQPGLLLVHGVAYNALADQRSFAAAGPSSPRPSISSEWVDNRRCRVYTTCS
jgi:hypothetical protein